MKQYTPLRQFYAWVGFFSLIILAALFAFACARFFLPKEQRLPDPEQLVAAVVTAYTSVPEETDDTPFVNAAGTRPHVGSIACPSKYPFGTIVVIEGQQYQCDDRMARRYQDDQHFDVWVPSVKQAVNFGKQLAVVTIVQ